MRPFAQRLDQCRVVDDRSARDVDQQRVRLHAGDAVAARSGRRVSGVSGQHSTMMSLCSTSSSIDRKPTPVGQACTLRLLSPPRRGRSRARRSDQPPGRWRRCRRCRWCGRQDRCRQLAWSRPASQPLPRRSRSTTRKRRSSARVTKITCSATDRALTPGTLATSTPARGGRLDRDHVEPGAVADRGAQPGRAFEKGGRQRRAHDDDVGVRGLARPALRHRGRRRSRVRRRLQHRGGARMQRVGRKDHRAVVRPVSSAALCRSHLRPSIRPFQ